MHGGIGAAAQSDATVIFMMTKALSGGSKRTEDFAKNPGKPCIHFKPRVDPKYLVIRALDQALIPT